MDLFVFALGKKTPLEHAVSGGNLPAVRFLLDHGADLHQEGEQGATVLHQAAMKGMLATARGGGIVTKSVVFFAKDQFCFINYLDQI